MNSLYTFVRHAASGEVFAVVYASEDSDRIVAISDALHHSEYRDTDETLRDPAEIEVSTEDAAWANTQPWSIVQS